MHVLITGGAGFIGSHLADYHLAKGDKVHILDDLSTGDEANIDLLMNHPDCQFDSVDILTWSGLSAAVAWADRIYHMAAVVGVRRVLEDPIKVMSTNMAGTERLLRAIHEDKWNPVVIIPSSSEVYGFNPDSPYCETDSLIFSSDGHLRWSYAVTKLADEFLAMAYHRKQGMRVITTRLFNTVGPRQVGRYGMVLPNFIYQAVNNLPLTVFGDGLQTRTFCDVRDAVMVLDMLTEIPEAMGDIINVGGETNISILDLAKLVRERANSSSEIRMISYHEAYGCDFEDIRHRKPSLDKLFHYIDFKHVWSLEETIDSLIEIEIEKSGTG